MTGSVAYILMGYPRVSETFIASEIHRIEQAGVPLRLYVIKPVEEREQGYRHPVQDAIRATPEYLPDPSLMTQELHLWRARHVRAFLPPLRRRIQELDVPVQLPGAVGPEALLDEYRRAGALCMPCRLLPADRDGIPNVLVEAMAAGAPVVATAVSGIPELVEHEVNGQLIEPDDPQALADALLRLHDDPELTRRLTDNARATVRERFDGDRLAHQLADLFRETL